MGTVILWCYRMCSQSHSPNNDKRCTERPTPASLVRNLIKWSNMLISLSTRKLNFSLNFDPEKMRGNIFSIKIIRICLSAVILFPALFRPCLESLCSKGIATLFPFSISICTLLLFMKVDSMALKQVKNYFSFLVIAKWGLFRGRGTQSIHFIYMKDNFSVWINQLPIWNKAVLHVWQFY